MRLRRAEFFLILLTLTALLSISVPSVQAEARGTFRGGGYGEEPRRGVVASVPLYAVAVVRAGHTYYLADGVYCQPCDAGGQVKYCMVDVPAGDDLDDVDDDNESDYDNENDENGDF
jgi:hypothetical protein